MKLSRAIRTAALILGLGFASHYAFAQVGGLPVVDFVDVYPHLIWVSTEGRDAEYPQGFRYKLVSVRREVSQAVEFVLIREVTGGTKVVAIHATGPASKFEETTKGVLERLGAKLGISFERYDLRDVRSFEQFRAKVSAFGWEPERVFQ